MKLHDAFAPAFLPYQRYWDDWIISDYCFLTAAELETLKLFRNIPSADALSWELNLSAQTIRNTIKRIIRKLHSGKPVFEEWKSKYTAGTDQSDYPLYVPITCLPISTRLKTSIYQIGNTLYEVFEVSGGDLKKYRRFGGGNQTELEEFLQSCGLNYSELVNQINSKNISPPGDSLKQQSDEQTLSGLLQVGSEVIVV